MAEAEQQWYYTVGEEKRGPVNLIALQAEIRNGQVPQTAMVWTATFGEQWKPLAQVPELTTQVQHATGELAELPEFESPWSDPKFVKKWAIIGISVLLIGIFSYLKFTKSAAAEAYLYFDKACFEHRFDEAWKSLASSVDAPTKRQIRKDVARVNTQGVWQNPWVYNYSIESDKKTAKDTRELVVLRVVKATAGAATRTRADTLTITMVKEGDDWKVSALSRESADPLRIDE